MTNVGDWYVIKGKDGICQILSTSKEQIPEDAEKWGPFASAEEAIAARIGLIRAGKCQPN
jgi:hypothetical protein